MTEQDQTGHGERAWELTPEGTAAAAERFRADHARHREQLGRAILGTSAVVHELLPCM